MELLSIQGIKKVLLFLLIITANLLVLWFIGQSSIRDTSPDVLLDDMGYPNEWSEKKLPQHPNASIVSYNFGDVILDGYSVTLESTDPIEEIAHYYSDEMTKRLYGVPSKAPTKRYGYYATYRQRGRYLSITVTQNPDFITNRIDLLYKEEK